MSTNDHVAVIGAGAWGTTLALVAHRAQSQVTLVAHRPELAAAIASKRRHPTSIPGIEIPADIAIASGDDADLVGISMAIIAIPVQRLRTGLPEWRGRIPTGTPILSVAKGIDSTTLQRPTEIMREVFGPDQPLAALSGPNLAREIAAGRPATTLIASDQPDLAASLVPALHGPNFRVYHGSDVIGLELGGALKNIVAIGAGMAEGLGAGDNAKASLMTRGLAEITRLGVACGAQAQTFAGISGMGDLIATCASPLSRNHRVGLGLAQGQDLATILDQLGETAEGVPTTRAARALAAQLGVEVPIIEQMDRVLFENLPVAEAIEHLVSRPPTGE